MRALIAEKPSVAKDIARLIGANNPNDGYMEGNGYLVTWAFGHLIELAKPEEYGFKGFNRENLPIIPDNFKLMAKQIKSDKGYKTDPGVAKQLRIIKEVFEKADEIVVATDAGREGELIFRYIYNYLGCQKPYLRLWISSLTDAAIKEGMNNLKPGRDYDNLYYSAKARSEADWLVGINATQSLTVSAKNGLYSLGRVQTPTLGMVCSRFLENKNFTPTPYWQLKAQIPNSENSLSVLSDEKWEDQNLVNQIYERIRNAMEMNVVKVESVEKSQEPPLLYDLTSLQKDANSKLGLSAADTLAICQTLYEKKFLSYPRTGSRYISKDVFEIMPDRIGLLKQYGPLSDLVDKVNRKSLNSKSVNDAKVTDHHALIITENIPRDLSVDQKTIYEMVAMRMLEAFSDKCIKDVTTVKLSISDVLFTLKGSVIKIPGWRAIGNYKEEDPEEQSIGNGFREGEKIPLLDLETVEKKTKPKPLHTEASLLAAMETAGKEIEDSELRESIKDCGIGTPATRAAVIETLLLRKYIERSKKNIIPTDKGLAVYEAVKGKQIANVSMTGEWENQLGKIERGECDREDFMSGIKSYTQSITSELLSIAIETPEEASLKCPKCNEGKIWFGKNVVKCSDPNCGFKVFRVIIGKQLADKPIRELIEKGKSSLVKGFKSKAGNEFDAYMTFDSDFNIKLEFPNKKDKK